MTTFFALLAGLLLGFIIGIVFTVWITLESSNLRDFMERNAIDSVPIYIYDEDKES